MNKSMNKIGKFLGAAMISLMLTSTLSAQTIGAAIDGQIGLQEPATGVMETIVNFLDYLNAMIIVITIFVFALLLTVMVKFNAKSNPNPSRRTHNTILEVVWTAVPVLILMVMAVPSFQLLWDQKVVPDGEREYANAGVLPAPDLTVKAIGNQWYWDYEYPDQGEMVFSSYMKSDDELEAGDLRLLSVDNEMVVPVNTTVRLLVTAGDVLHSFALPSFGIKVDAVPGRINETWFNANKEGVFYGQCSEICGKDHAFMPIAIRVVSQEEFDSWAEKMMEEYASNDPEGEMQNTPLLLANR